MKRVLVEAWHGANTSTTEVTSIPPSESGFSLNARKYFCPTATCPGFSNAPVRMVINVQ